MTRLKELRKEKSFTQDQLSLLTGIPQNQISRFEKGSKMNEAQIVAFCKVFDVSSDYFLKIKSSR